MRPLPILTVASVATAALCAGCGSGGPGTTFGDVEPCLDKLGTATAIEPEPTTTEEGADDGSADVPVPQTISDVRFDTPGAGASVVHLVFYGSRGDVRKALDQAASSGIVGALPPERVAKTVLVSWPTQPTENQRQLVVDCLEK